MIYAICICFRKIWVIRAVRIYGTSQKVGFNPKQWFISLTDINEVG